VSIKFDDNWLSWAAQIEDEADCDISAGLDHGQHLGEYLEMVMSKPKSISHSRLLSVLHDELGTSLTEEEIKKLASDIQSQVQNAISNKSIAA
jgi:hypothetical protein